MENRLYVDLDEITADNIEDILGIVAYVGMRMGHEIVLPAGIVENTCKEKQYSCYQFAHDLEGNPYIRARVNQTTVEFLVRKISENPNEKESLVLWIKNNGKTIYRKPEKPERTICVI